MASRLEDDLESIPLGIIEWHGGGRWQRNVLEPFPVWSRRVEMIGSTTLKGIFGRVRSDVRPTLTSDHIMPYYYDTRHRPLTWENYKSSSSVMSSMFAAEIPPTTLQQSPKPGGDGSIVSNMQTNKFLSFQPNLYFLRVRNATISAR